MFRKRPPNLHPPTHECSPRRQAIAAWCWCNFLHSQIGPTRHALRLNLDETSIPMFFGDHSGLLVLPAAMNRRAALQQLFQRVPRKHLRGAFTWVCIIADMPEVQRRLPQFLIGNAAILPLRDAQTLQGRLPRNVRLWRRKSSWQDANGLIEIFAAVRVALEPWFARGFMPILHMDAARFHLMPKVALACAACGLMLHIIPASMTWCLQPCDTHVFSGFKRKLRESYEAQRLTHGRHTLDTVQFLSVVARCMATEVIQKTWANAFDACGLSHGQDGLRPSILQKLQFAARPIVGDGPPSLEQLQHVYPARTQIPLAELFHPWRAVPRAHRRLYLVGEQPEDPPQPPAPAPAPPEAHADGAHAAGRAPWLPPPPPLPPPPMGPRPQPGPPVALPHARAADPLPILL